MFAPSYGAAWSLLVTFSCSSAIPIILEANPAPGSGDWITASRSRYRSASTDAKTGFGHQSVPSIRTVRITRCCYCILTISATAKMILGDSRASSAGHRAKTINTFYCFCAWWFSRSQCFPLRILSG